MHISSVIPFENFIRCIKHRLPRQIHHIMFKMFLFAASTKVVDTALLHLWPSFLLIFLHLYWRTISRHSRLQSRLQWLHEFVFVNNFIYTVCYREHCSSTVTKYWTQHRLTLNLCLVRHELWNMFWCLPVLATVTVDTSVTWPRHSSTWLVT